MKDWEEKVIEGAVADVAVVHKDSRLPAKMVLYRGHIDCMGIAFGAIVYDIMNPPWKDLIDIPNEVYMMDRRWAEILSLR